MIHMLSILVAGSEVPRYSQLSEINFYLLQVEYHMHVALVLIMLLCYAASTSHKIIRGQCIPFSTSISFQHAIMNTGRGIVNESHTSYTADGTELCMTHGIVAPVPPLVWVTTFLEYYEWDKYL